MALISVIVPIYNVAEYLPRCLDSIINQTYKELEIILVDDGSEDNSADICYAYAEKDKRIMIIQKENTGAAAAKVTGLRYASGKFITFCDSDDYLEPDMYEILYQNLQNYNVSISMCEKFLVKNGCVSSKKKFFHKEMLLNSKEEIFACWAMDSTFTALWSKLFRRDVIANLKESPKVEFDDEEFFVQWIDNAATMHINDMPLYYYVQRNNSVCARAKGVAAKVLYENTQQYKLLSQKYPQFEKYARVRLLKAYRRAMSWLVDKSCIKTQWHTFLQIHIPFIIYSNLFTVKDKFTFILLVYVPFMYRILYKYR